MNGTGKKVCLITMGCPKNDVDSELLWGVLKPHNVELVDSAEDADMIFINTCGFIKDAKQESVNTILSAAALKLEMPGKELYVWGCLSERYKEELQKDIPEVDRYFGVESFYEIEKYLFGTETASTKKRIRPKRLATPNHTAYLKISDGCSHKCTFCAIPLIKGGAKSLSFEKVIEEAEMLASQGVKEIILVGQDTTAYGEDIDSSYNLSSIIRGIADISSVEWIRIMYAHPAKITSELIDTIAEEEKVCKYLDLPLQHISSSVLKRMGRNMTREQTESVVRRLRSAIPEIVLRTAFIVGFPGETEEEFNELLDFVGEEKFERLGCFIFSPEEGTPAYLMSGRVDKNVAEERYRMIMNRQAQISEEINRSLESTVQKVIVDGFDKQENMFYGRTCGDCPEIDQTVWIDSSVETGDIVSVIIEEGFTYDLRATLYF
ncbi:30S ribosomal protein S12 methylthiotransferase RimO [bacterium]|nr:30S ribosomal protein S12 methylthiotransferase RimO [bacterium]